MSGGHSIVLIGPMGSGKTTVGRLLADRLGWQFLDTDTLVEQQAGQPIAILFAGLGESCFRQWERRVLSDVVGLNHRVISTGGGIVLCPDNRLLLRRCGRVAVLLAPADELANRLWLERENRPLIRDISSKERLSNYLEVLLRERMALYLQVGVPVETGGCTPEDVVEILVRLAPHFTWPRSRRGRR